MKVKHALRAGPLSPEEGLWVVVDIGFSNNSKSCGIQVDGLHQKPLECQFGELSKTLLELSQEVTDIPMNLVIEAPLSVAFNAAGNPIGRSFERGQGTQTRYWYVGLGSCVMVAAMYVLKPLVDARPKRPIHLYEGFVTFKPKGESSNHSADVELLRKHAEHHPLVAVTALEGGVVRSAFDVMGLDIGIPPIIGLSSSHQARYAPAGFCSWFSGESDS